MPLAQETQGAAGIGVVDLAPGIAGGRHVHAVIDQNRAEDQGEEHVVFFDKLLCLFLRLELAAIAEEQIPVGGDVADVAAVRLEAADLPLVDGDAAGAPVVVEVAAHGQHRVGVLGETAAALKIQVKGRVPGDLPPQLGAVGDENLREGAHRPGLRLLPDEHQERLVQIPADGRVGDAGDLGVPAELLPVNERLGLRPLQQRLDHRRVVGLAEALGIRNRAGQRVLGDPIAHRQIGQSFAYQGEKGFRHRIRVSHLQKVQHLCEILLARDPGPVLVTERELQVELLGIAGGIQRRVQFLEEGRLQQLGADGLIVGIDLTAAGGGVHPALQPCGHCRCQIRPQGGLVQARQAEQLPGFIALDVAVPLRADGAYRLQGLKEAFAALGLRLGERLGHGKRGDGLGRVGPLQPKLYHDGYGVLTAQPHAQGDKSTDDRQQKQQDGKP